MCEQRHPCGVEGRRDRSPHDVPEVDVGDVSDPELVRAVRGETAYHQIWAGILCASRAHGARPTAPAPARRALASAGQTRVDSTARVEVGGWT